MQVEVNIDVEPLSTKDSTPYQEKHIPKSFDQGKQINRFEYSCSYLFRLQHIILYKIYLLIIYHIKETQDQNLIKLIVSSF